jgi:hypothetical protein
MMVAALGLTNHIAGEGTSCLVLTSGCTGY